ncbi:MAG: alanine racemase [Bacteroidetes bacterium]|nr:alanine racemase [Bacteroidota bacterium]MCL5027356.1 alanine racemase [Chloroflexota bacterium]
MTADFRGRPAWAEIDLDAIAANVRALRACTGPGVQLAAVVKANAYGHGMEAVAGAALEAGATWLAVNTADEGVRLRVAGFACRVLVMGYAAAWEAGKIVTNDLTPTLNTMELALGLASAAAASGKTVNVHVKLDTGLGRFGLLPEEVLPFVQALSGIPRLRLEGIWTHFASADETDKAYTHRQLAVYHHVLASLAAHGITLPLRHAANSAATMEVPESHLDLVRCGIALYGLYPSPEVGRGVALRPAMALKSRIARVRTLPAGSSISYNRTYTTSAPTRVALVPIGYADGLTRALSNRGALLVHGRRAPIVGRVCMDQCVVNVDHIPGVAQDDEAVAIGAQGDEEITADEVAALASTINYEITCNVSARVPRVYLRDGQIVAIS